MQLRGGQGKFRFVEGGTEYGIKEINFETHAVKIVKMRLTLDQARAMINLQRAMRITPADKKILHGIVWLGRLWEDEYEEVKL
jgi:nitric oxide reductase activation protein